MSHVLHAYKTTLISSQISKNPKELEQLKTTCLIFNSSPHVQKIWLTKIKYWFSKLLGIEQVFSQAQLITQFTYRSQKKNPITFRQLRWQLLWMNSLQGKLFHFGSIIIKVYSWRSNWQHVSIGSCNGLAPNRCQAITWTNDDIRCPNMLMHTYGPPCF